MKSKIELIDSLKQMGAFGSYEDKALKNLPENILIEESLHSIIIFKSRQEKWLEKEVIGEDKNPLDTFL